MAFCTKCGAKIGDTASFCTVCGAARKPVSNNAPKKMESRGNVQKTAPGNRQEQPKRRDQQGRPNRQAQQKRPDLRRAAGSAGRPSPVPKKPESGNKSRIIIIICIIAIAAAAAAIILMLLKNSGQLSFFESKTKTEAEDNRKKDKADKEDADEEEDEEKDKDEDKDKDSEDKETEESTSASSETASSSVESETPEPTKTETPEPTKTETPSPTPTATPSPTVTATPTATPTPTASPTPTSEPTPTAKPKPQTSVKKAADVSLGSYKKAGVSSATATSELVQVERPDISNAASMAVDGDVITSWQEAVNGHGEGEYIDITLSGKYDIRAITFNMGNWRDDENYRKNSRPKDITIWLGSESFNVTVPDGKTQYCVEFSSAVNADKVTVRIDSVYKGDEWDDTCISEITVYSE